MKQKFTKLKIILPYIAVIFSAFLYSYSVRAFVNKAELLTGGFSGIALILARYIGMLYYQVGSLSELLGDASKMDFVNTLTSVFFFVFNIPLIILAFKQLGKRFAMLSTTYIIFNTIFIRVLPNEILDIFELGASNEMANALFAGVLGGLAIGLALKVGGSTGGMEIIGTYYSRKKQMSIGRFSTIMNAIIIILGGIIFQKWTPILYTLVLVFVSGRIVDTIHRFTNKVLVQVVTNNCTEIANTISVNTHYNSTLIEAKGGFTGEIRYMIIIIIPESKVGHIVELIQKIDDKAFITTLDVNNVYGNFYLEPLK